MDLTAVMLQGIADQFDPQKLAIGQLIKQQVSIGHETVVAARIASTQKLNELIRLEEAQTKPNATAIACWQKMLNEYTSK